MRPETIKGLRRRPKLVVLVIAFSVLVGLILSFAIGIHHRDINAFPETPVRGPYVPAMDPVGAAERGIVPGTPLGQAPASPSIRTILVKAEKLSLVAGGVEARRIRLSQPVKTMTEVALAIGDATWIEEKDGVITLRAGLVLEAGTSLEVSAPATTRLQMVNRPGVMLGARQATLHMSGVTVTSVTEPTTEAGPAGYRPFVVAAFGSKMTIDDSVLSDLGWDWNGSYGVSWMDDSTGGATDTRFERNFIGVYTHGATNLRLLNNLYDDNRLYGLDPHTGSNGLEISGGRAEGNGKHGVIFSDHVTQSTVIGLVSRGNGANGIMVDRRSTHNAFNDNIVEDNGGDGIAIADSPANVVTDNLVKGNRVGIHISGAVEGMIISRNRLSDNDLAVQGIVLQPDNTTDGNGSDPNKGNLFIIGRLTIFGGIVLMVVGLWSLRRSSRNRRTQEA